MLVTVTVLLAGTTYSFFALRHSMAEERAMVANSQRVTTLLSRIAQDLALDRASVLESLTEEPSSLGPLAESIAREVRDLDQATAELGPLLRSDEQAIWAALSLRIRGFEDELALAFAFARRGQAAAAEEMLDRVAGSATPLFGDLAALTRQHGEIAHAGLLETEGRLSLALTIALFSSAITAAFVMTIWLVAVKRLRQQQRALASYTARVENANRELDAFAGRVAHDLKNIISPIPLANDLICAHPNEPVLIERSSQRIQRSVRNAIDVLEGLLTFTRARELEVKPEAAAVADEALAVADELQPQLTSLGAELRLDVAPGTEVACGHSLLHIVLLNVVGNAVKFLEDRPVKRVILRARTEGQETVIEVEDTGPGIAEQELDRIFEPFYRAPGTSAAGHGIGLATVRRVVQRSGGRIGVKSTPGEGSTFRIVLPRMPSGPRTAGTAAVAAAVAGEAATAEARQARLAGR